MPPTRPTREKYNHYVLVRQRRVVVALLERCAAVAHLAGALVEVRDHAVEHEVRLEDVAEALAPPAARDGERLVEPPGSVSSQSQSP